MNISRKWLREFVDITATDKEYDSVMTLAGQKVETTERMDAEIKNVVVGKVLSMKKHENSDHMWVCMVDDGSGEPVQIVTGAQNVHEGDLVPVARHNSWLPGGVHITKGKLRGVESCGMLCSYKELGLTEQDFLTLTVAEMTKNKNHSTVLKALALLKNEPGYETMHYLICGRGEQRDALESEARQLGIWEHVQFLGYRHDVPELCRCSDIFAFMSFREGMPVALMEAMSSGLPAVCSKIRGNTDLIDDGVDGLFAENTPEGVAAAILKLYHDPALREQLGRAASQTVSRFDAKAVQQKMKEIYLSV